MYSLRPGGLEQGEEFTEVFSWGNDELGQLGLGVNQKKNGRQKTKYSVPRYCSFNISISRMACGQDHSVFITASGLVYSMGSNRHG